ncbi:MULTISPECIES: response regulator [unclassified Oceanispirochaeta]|uniref:response regulator n=1 Tax=unclassified Oceanispirochaeta TaxID=2635722 RepID=UPI000E09D376|nr:MULTISPECIES: response regulator [unclassified Oceanispirochaeta]MBF9014651.1 response regulator [Oceanispirochaeta sp. M2]NPD70907.1 response regulator [Oceanispirochaeta sp. M1]RDG33742.1 response regulator [Oceanispirochaeta sp. M1]
MQVFGKVEMTVRGGDVLKEEKQEGFEKIKAARILLAEDNEINQQVALETLEQEGFRVDVVNNGNEALASHREGYDCILMDLQMPEVENENDIPCIPGIDIQDGLNRVRGNCKLFRNLPLFLTYC